MAGDDLTSVSMVLTGTGRQQAGYLGSNPSQCFSVDRSMAEHPVSVNTYPYLSGQLGTG
jgi:hypothetical protein